MHIKYRKLKFITSQHIKTTFYNSYCICNFPEFSYDDAVATSHYTNQYSKAVACEIYWTIMLHRSDDRFRILFINSNVAKAQFNIIEIEMCFGKGSNFILIRH